MHLRSSHDFFPPPQYSKYSQWMRIYIFLLSNWTKCETNLKRREIGFPRYGKPTFIHDLQEIKLVCDVWFLRSRCLFYHCNMNDLDYHKNSLQETFKNGFVAKNMSNSQWWCSCETYENLQHANKSWFTVKHVYKGWQKNSWRLPRCYVFTKDVSSRGFNTLVWLELTAYGVQVSLVCMRWEKVTLE